MQALGVSRPRGRQQAGEQAAWIAQPALLPLLPDMRHGLHHGSCAMSLDRLVEVAGRKTKSVCLLASLDLALGVSSRLGRCWSGSSSCPTLQP